MLDRMREMSALTSREALAGIPSEEIDRVIETLLKIKGNLLALDAAENGAQGDRKSTA